MSFSHIFEVKQAVEIIPGFCLWQNLLTNLANNEIAGNLSGALIKSNSSLTPSFYEVLPTVALVFAPALDAQIGRYIEKDL